MKATERYHFRVVLFFIYLNIASFDFRLICCFAVRCSEILAHLVLFSFINPNGNKVYVCMHVCMYCSLC